MLRRPNSYQSQVNRIKDQQDQLFDILQDMQQTLIAYIQSPTSSKREELQRLENQVDQFEEDIEQAIFDILTVRQPEVTYMKLFLSILRSIKDLERIGDQTMNFVNLYDKHPNHPSYFKESTVHMIETEYDMLSSTRRGIQNKDQEPLEKVIEEDEIVDHHHKSTNERIVQDMQNEQLDAAEGSKMIMMLRFLERLGDNIVNVCETYIDYFYLNLE